MSDDEPRAGRQAEGGSAVICQQYGFRGEDEGHPLKYVRLMAEIRDAVKFGRYRPGDCLPSIQKIHHERGWARATIAKAYRKLADEGIVERFAGYGYMVPRKNLDGVKLHSQRRLPRNR